MNDKEKLISLLILTDPNPYTCESESGSCELTTCTECRARSTADLLIANGVTVQECKLGAKKTNADRIRSMSDEELVQMRTIGRGGFSCSKCAESEDCGQNCEVQCLKWLKQPAEVIE